MSNYTTRQGDCLDQICREVYGTERGGTVEAVLEANTGLANYGVTLPQGLVLVMPVLNDPATVVEPIYLWD